MSNPPRGNRLLLDESSLQVQPSLAVAIGLNEAIALQQLHFWLKGKAERKDDDAFIDGRWWVFNSIREWREKSFPFWSDDTVERTFKKLVKLGLVIRGHYAVSPYDRRHWYTIDYAVMDNLNLQQSITADCSNPLPQLAAMDKRNLHQSDSRNLRQSNTKTQRIQAKTQDQEVFAAVAAAPPPPDPPPPAVKPAPKPRSRKPTRTPEQHALQERVVQALEEVTGKPRTVNQSGYQAVGWWLVDSFPDLGETLPEVVRERYAEDAPTADGWQWYTHDFRGMGRKEPSRRPTVFQVRETIYDALQPPPAPTVALTPYTNGHSRDRPASFAGLQIEQSLASIAAMREERLRRETGGT